MGSIQSKKKQPQKLRVATLNYCDIMNNAFQFYSQGNLKATLQQISKKFNENLKKKICQDKIQNFFKAIKDIDKQFRQRFSPFFLNIHKQYKYKQIQQKQFREKWNDKYLKHTGKKYTQQIKQNLFKYDYVMYTSLNEFINQNNQNNKEIINKFYEQSYLNHAEKAKKMAYYFERLYVDILFLQQSDQRFIKYLRQKNGQYFIYPEKQPQNGKKYDNVIVACKKSFNDKQVTKLSNFLQSIQKNQNQFKKLITFKSQKDVSTSYMIIDNYVFLGVHLSSDKKNNKEEVITLKKNIEQLKKLVKTKNKKYQLVIAGDLNSYVDFQQIQYYPKSQSQITTIKKRSYCQAQYKKADQIIKQSKDKIISTLKLQNQNISCISGYSSKIEQQFLPTNDHPFDHFIILADIQRNDILNNNRNEQYYNVATLNYTAKMNNPFQFYCDGKLRKQLQHISYLFIQIMKKLLQIQKKNSRELLYNFFDQFSKHQKYLKYRYSPFCKLTFGIKDNKLMTQSQIKEQWIKKLTNYIKDQKKITQKQQQQSWIKKLTNYIEDQKKITQKQQQQQQWIKKLTNYIEDQKKNSQKQKQQQQKLQKIIKVLLQQQKQSKLFKFDYCMHLTLINYAFYSKFGQIIIEDIQEKKPNLNVEDYTRKIKKFYQQKHLQSIQKFKILKNQLSKQEIDILFLQKFKISKDERRQLQKKFQVHGNETCILVKKSSQFQKQQNIKHQNWNKQLILKKIKQKIQCYDYKKNKKFENSFLQSQILILKKIVLIGIHLSWDQQNQKQQFQILQKVIQYFKQQATNQGKDLIIGGDFNFSLKDIGSLISHYPTNKNAKTSRKMRTYAQAQFKKAQLLFDENVDQILTTLPINRYKSCIRDFDNKIKQNQTQKLLPTDNHPFDHYLVEVKISKNSLVDKYQKKEIKKA